MGAGDGDDDEEPSVPEATEAELEERHERELSELRERSEAHVAAAKASAKGKKAKAALEAAEREVDQWQYDLQQRQAEELEILQGRLEGGGGEAAPEPVAESPPAEAAPSASPEEDEAERNKRKKEKAMKKKQNRAAKQAEHEADIEREKSEAGPSLRAQELAELAMQLAKCRPPLRVLEVAADGHCLYRALGDQLRRVRPELHSWTAPAEKHHEEVRALCAASLREREDDYSPFAELQDGEDFGGYCKRVEHSGDWGGELELRAIADKLHVRILVHRAGEREPLVLGKEHRGDSLQVTYHRHYYALGEHYNSAVPRDA